MGPIDALGRAVKRNIFPLAVNPTRFSGLSAHTLLTTPTELLGENFNILIIRMSQPGELCHPCFVFPNLSF